ncbi:hypothetical protein V7S43_004531 [Phytophthora oleae]|uniref:Uncharacterized protein n=1 Tax=Phytophthora oleae TaxID=2107226 RepID=A0ABD3FTJ5_9STRA
MKKGEKTALIEELTHTDKELQGEDCLATVLKEMDGPLTGQIHVLVVLQEGLTRRAQEELEWPPKKRQKTHGIPLNMMENLVNLVNMSQGLSRSTDLDVGQVVELPNDLFGIGFCGGLYIREEYWTLHDMMMQKFASGYSSFLVTGSLGIGKSIFGVFLLLVFLAERKNVAYRALGESVTYFFTWTEQNEYEISDEPVGMREYEGLFDGNEHKALGSDEFLHKYLFANPCTENYNKFVKDSCFKVYMNPWTKSECEKLAAGMDLEDPDARSGPMVKDDAEKTRSRNAVDVEAAL